MTYLKENKILSQWIPPRTSQYNGVLERKNQTIRHSSVHDGLCDSANFFLEICSWNCLLHNKVPSKSVNKIPYEIWSGCKPVLSHLRVWGCLIYVKHLKIDMFGPRSNKYLFIGYLKETKQYYFYLADKQKVFVSFRIVFLEKKKNLEKGLIPLRLNLRMFNR